MSELVANCPRCGAKKITFVLVNSIECGCTHLEWQNVHEAFCLCGNCHKTTVFVLIDKFRESKEVIDSKGGLRKVGGTVNELVGIDGYICLKDERVIDPPDYLPDNIRASFQEATKCLAIKCYNAAGAMFRLCLDMATISLLPDGEVAGLNHNVRKKLGFRLPWLFETGRLSDDLKDLATCIREDGNDGAHTGLLGQEDAEDLLDFTFELLERIYTEPARIRLAQERRAARREKK